MGEVVERGEMGEREDAREGGRWERRGLEDVEDVVVVGRWEVACQRHRRIVFRCGGCFVEAYLGLIMPGWSG